jgi:hypothetical protein
VTSKPPEPAPLERVAIVEEEVVMPGGAAIVSWLVRYHDGWVRAQSHPSASSERLERGSGVVWRTRVTLELPRGTELVRVETRPAAGQKSALDHLTGGARGAPRKTLRRAYRVGAGGELAFVKAPVPK